MPRLPRSPALDLDRVKTHVLGNGLRVRLLPDPGSGTVSCYTFFQVGSRNERLGRTGISHLFEHMMFNGSERYGPKEFDRILEAHGGASNAYTSNDLTAYHADFAVEALPVVIDLESDRIDGDRYRTQIRHRPVGVARADTQRQRAVGLPQPD